MLHVESYVDAVDGYMPEITVYMCTHEKVDYGLLSVTLRKEVKLLLKFKLPKIKMSTCQLCFVMILLLLPISTS